VDYIAEVINFKQKLQQWIAIASAAVIGVLVMISIFLISNDIKLAVEARRKEIRIMKYVGATDSFIRLPFIIEGVIIGIIGAILAFFIIGYVYSLIASKLNESFAGLGPNVASIIHIIDFSPVALKLMATYAIIGLTVGITGSIITIRKHLAV
jgi:cell division transport system permease protein